MDYVIEILKKEMERVCETLKNSQNREEIEAHLRELQQAIFVLRQWEKKNGS